MSITLPADIHAWEDRLIFEWLEQHSLSPHAGGRSRCCSRGSAEDGGARMLTPALGLGKLAGLLLRIRRSCPIPIPLHFAGKLKMYRVKCLLAVLLSLLLAAPVLAVDVRREIHFPDLHGYQTLVCDLHMHTVFSDGQVWPPVRVQEAWRQGLDAIAITDHVEHQPHKDDVPTSHNRPYELAVGPARAANLLLARSAEITRDTPPGHFNAIFLSDDEPLDTKDFVEAIKRANEQGAFVFWNHQEWKGPEKGRWLDVHTTLYENEWLHGMEVCNGESYYPDAHKWCLEKKLTMLGTSDIHHPDLRQESLPDDHRTMTLVFADERTLESLKEALKEGRTAVWFADRIIGHQQWLEPLFNGSVQVSRPHLRSQNTVWVEIRNGSSADIRLQRTGGGGPNELNLPARSTSIVKIKTPTPTEPLELRYTVTNFLIGVDAGLPVVFQIPGKGNAE